MHTLSICIVWLACCASVSLLSSAPTLAQPWPAKPIRLVVGFGAGTPPDVFGRLIAGPLGDALGERVLVENRPGRGSTLASAQVANAAPDGYTLAMGTTGTLAIGPALFANPGFDPVRSFAPISLIARAPIFLVVHPSVPATTVREFLEHAQARPTPLLYGSGGNGSPPHLLMELLKFRTGTDLLHVPYKDSQVPALIAGDVLVSMLTPATFGGLHRAGKLRPLAVASERRDPGWPEVPTLSEAGVPGIVADTWTGVVAPAGTPPAVIGRLNEALNRTVGSVAIREAFAKMSTEAVASTPDGFGALISAEVTKWAGAIRAAGVKPD